MALIGNRVAPALDTPALLPLKAANAFIKVATGALKLFPGSAF